MRRLPKFVKLIFATVMTLGMYTGITYGGDGAPPKITVQPESQRNVYGANVEFSITATGENLKYQWQYKPRIKGGTWTNSTDSGATTNKLKLVANDQNEYLYRCLVSNDTYSGDKAIMSNAASLYVIDDQIFEIKYISETPTAPVITTQPLSQMLSVGEKATFTVEATGTDLTYQWQYKPSLPNSAWTNLTKSDGIGFDTNTFTTAVLTGTQDHYQYRCLVRSKNYYYGDENAKESDSATLLILSATQIADVQFDNSKLMITEWTIPADNTVIKLPVQGTGLNITVDWGDGSATETVTTQFPTHTYAQAGIYEIAVAGNCPVWGKYSGNVPTEGNDYYTYAQYLSKVIQFGELNATYYGFTWCTNLTDVKGATVNSTKNVTDMSYMFARCDNLTNLDTSNFDTSKVTNMIGMFASCRILKNLDVSSFNISNVTNTSNMFSNCAGLTNLDVSGFDTSNVTNMSFMFSNCEGLTNLDVSNFNTLKVIDMTYMFYGCNNLKNLNLSNFDTLKVTNMAYMFYGCNNLTELNLSNFNTSRVTNMTAMFNECSSLINLDVTNFDTSKVTQMWNMFNGCKSLNSINLNNFDTSSVENMISMFFGCNSLKCLDLSGFDTSKVTMTLSMFASCSNLKSIQISNRFKIPTSRNDNMFTNTPTLKSIIIVDSEPLASQFTPVKSQLTGKTIYVPNKVAETAYEESWSGDFTADRIQPILELVGDENVTIKAGETYTDAGYTVAGFDKTNSGDYTVYGYNVTTSGEVNTTVVGTYKIEYILTRTYTNAGVAQTDTLMSVERTVTVEVNEKAKMITEWTIPAANTTIKLPVRGTGLNITVDWGDGSSEQTVTTEFPTHTYATAGTYEIKVWGTCPNWGYDLDVSPTVTNYYNRYYTYTQYLSKVKQFGELNATSYGFACCKNLTEASGENLVTSKTFEKVTAMENMFYFCKQLTRIDVSGFNTSNVVNMTKMFSNCSSLTNLDVSSFNTSNVVNMANMFSNCSSLTNLDVSKFDTSNVVNMTNMFWSCSSLTNLDVSSFNTSKVTNMSNMFDHCQKLTSLDLTSFNTSNVTNMTNMFYCCESLTNLDISSFDTSKVTSMTQMFSNCENLTVLDISGFDTSNVTSMYSMFGQCYSLTGLDVSGFDTNKVTSMGAMFYNCSRLTNLNVSKFDTSNVTDMKMMFYMCVGLTKLDVSGFDTNKVTNMRAMFSDCSRLTNLNVSKFDTSNVTDMSRMFYYCSKLTSLDVSGFDTSKVKYMSGMFRDCNKLTSLDVSGFDTSKVTDMSRMFYYCRNLKSIQLSNKFKIPSSGITDMFTNTTNLKSIILVDTTPLANQFTNVKDQLNGKTIYVPSKAAEAAYEESWSGDFSGDRIRPILELVGEEKLTINKGETYTEAGATVAGFTKANSGDYTVYGYNVTTSGEVNTANAGTYKIEYTLTRTYNNGTGTVTEEIMKATRTVEVIDTASYMITEWNVSGDVGLTITLPVSGTGLNITVDWGDGSATETITTEYPTHTYAQAGIYEIEVAGNCPEWGKISYQEFIAFGETSRNYTYAKYLTNVIQLGELNATKYIFAKCENLTSFKGEKLVSPNTFTNVNTMGYMFWGCTNLKEIDLTNFDTQNVTDMNRMFSGCQSLVELDLTSLDTSKVTDMNDTFGGCKNLENLNISNLKTNLVKNMSYMFSGCGKLKALDFSSFDTSNVTNMGWMFGNCSSLESLDLSSFDTSNVKNMSFMFNNCGAKTIDVSSFNTSNVENMHCMFQLTKVKQIDLSSFKTQSLKSMTGMFAWSSFESLDLSSFDTSNVTGMVDVFKNCGSLGTLDISSFDTTDMTRLVDENGNVTEGMDGILNGTSKLKSIQISDKFIIPDGSENVFNNCNSLTAIITTSPTPVANQFKGLLPSNATLYVPNGAEGTYKATLSGDTSSSKIKPIIEPIGESGVRVVQGSEYIDEGCTVAGFTGVDSIYYTCYGYGVSSTSDVDTTTTGNYKVRYSLTKDGTDFSNAERDVEVLEMPSAPTNFKVSDATSSDKINLTWETNGMAETTKCKLEYLDDTGAWKKLLDNATSPYIHSGLSNNKAYEYRISAVTKDGVQSKFAYAIGRTAYDELEIIIRNDKIAPIIEFVEMIPEAEYIASNNTIKIKFKAEDINYKYEESDIKAEDIVIKVGGIVNSDAIKKITKLKTTNGEEYELELSNVTGVGKLELVIPKDKIVDKAGNKNIETTLNIPTFVANGGISDTKPTVTVDENEITIINNQTSIAKIVKIEYQYRISGDTEFTTIPNGASGDTATSNILKDALADTYYEIRTVVEDSTGNKKESKTVTVKTSSLDSGLISVSINPTTLTSGDVTATITYNSKFHKEYSTDGTNYISLTNGNTKELIVKANLTIYARLTDGKNYSNVVTYEVNNIDKERPVIGKVEVSPSGKSNSKQIIATDVKDIGVSGIKGYYISKTADIDNPTWVSFEGTSFAYTIKENGTYYVWVSDNVGNISEAEIVIATGIVSGVGNITYNEEMEISVGETAKIEITYTGEAMSESYSSSNSSIVKVEKNIRQIEGVSVGVANVVVVIKDYDGTEHQVIIKVTVKPTELQAKLMSDGVDYNGEWTNKDVNAILTTNGTKPFEYKEKESKNGAWTKPENVSAGSITGLTTITYSGDYSGEKYYTGVNKDGNIVTSEAGAFVVRLDKTAPTIGAAKKTPGTNSIDVAIIGATDNLSDIKEYEIGIYKDNVCLGTYKGASGEATFIQLSSSTTYQIKYKITDNAGNETDMIDGGSETTGIIRKVVTYDYLTNGGTSVSLASEERIAGTMIDLTVTATKTGYNFKGWAKTPSGDVLTSLVMPEEDITLYAIFKDEDAPKVEDKSYETVDGELDIILKPSDDGSGIGGYAVTTDDGTPNRWEMKEPDADGFVRITVPGTNKYYVWIKDLEGNFVRYEQIAIKDIFAPTGKIEVKENIVNDLPYANRNEVNLKITAEDNESKPENIKIAIYNEEEYKNIKSYASINFAYNYVDGGLETKHQTTPGDGLKRIYVIFKDKAGNISMTIKQLP